MARHSRARKMIARRGTVGPIARSTLDTLVAQGSKLSETLVELSGQIAEPFASRCIATAERVKTVTFEA